MRTTIQVCPGVEFNGCEVWITSEAKALSDADLIHAVRIALMHNDDAVLVEAYQGRQGPLANRGMMSLDEYLRELEITRLKDVTKQARSDLIKIRRHQFQGSRAALALALIEAGCLYQCAWCGGVDDLTIDHVIPLSRGGTDELANLRWLCRSCNSVKGASLTQAST